MVACQPDHITWGAIQFLILLLGTGGRWVTDVSTIPDLTIKHDHLNITFSNILHCYSRVTHSRQHEWPQYYAPACIHVCTVI
jgi:hypothetical protein